MPVAVKPSKTLKGTLVHLTDIQDEAKVPCANCDKTYTGETGRKFVVRLQEQDQSGVKNQTGFHKKSTCIQLNRTQQIHAHRAYNSQATVIDTSIHYMVRHNYRTP